MHAASCHYNQNRTEPHDLERLVEKIFFSKNKNKHELSLQDCICCIHNITDNISTKNLMQPSHQDGGLSLKSLSQLLHYSSQVRPSVQQTQTDSKMSNAAGQQSQAHQQICNTFIKK